MGENLKSLPTDSLAGVHCLSAMCWEVLLLGGARRCYCWEVLGGGVASKKCLGANVSQAIRRASRPLSLSVKGDLGDLVYLLAMI